MSDLKSSEIFSPRVFGCYESVPVSSHPYLCSRVLFRGSGKSSSGEQGNELLSYLKDGQTYLDKAPEERNAPRLSPVYCRVEHYCDSSGGADAAAEDAAPPSSDVVTELLNSGCHVVYVSQRFMSDGAYDSFPEERLGVAVPYQFILSGGVDALGDAGRRSTIIDFSGADERAVQSVIDLLAQANASAGCEHDHLTEQADIVLLLPESSSTSFVESLVPKLPENFTVSIKEAPADTLSHFLSLQATTDRVDGLYTTVVTDEIGVALGLVYSSKESIRETLRQGYAVYYSRSRKGLWKKGATSGNLQICRSIKLDCDGDAVNFTVCQLPKVRDAPAVQKGDFCHLNRYTCWGPSYGLSALEATVLSRLANPTPGSYTNRIMSDPELLKNKLLEESLELLECNSPSHASEELADVLYFALIKACKEGVSYQDAAAVLERRRFKVTRRKGDSKKERIQEAEKVLGGK